MIVAAWVALGRFLATYVAVHAALFGLRRIILRIQRKDPHE